MRIISYSTSDIQNEQIENFIDTTGYKSLRLSFQGSDDNQGFVKFIKTLQVEDIVVFFSIRPLFTSIEYFMMFLRFCQSLQIRIISLQDEIDTADQIFPLACSSHWMDILCSLKSSKPIEHDDLQSDMMSENSHERMLKKYKMVVNLYTAGYSIGEILRLTGYKAKPTIYRILHRYGIELEYPSMQRIYKEK